MTLIDPNGGKLTREPPAPPNERCGTCHFGWLCADDQGAIECHGVPPTPVPMQAGRDLAGNPTTGLALFRPRLSPLEPACALWGPRQGDVRVTGAPQQIGRKLVG